MSIPVFCDISDPAINAAFQALALAGYVEIADTNSDSVVYITDKALAAGESQVLRVGFDVQTDVHAQNFPVKPRVLLQKIRTLHSGVGATLPERIDLGGLSVFPALLEIVDENSDKKVVITEKERDVLVFLFSRPEYKASREELLSAVWGYGQGIDTHTLETHIYRLRQKIETKASSPQILITTEDGYGLKIQ
jgi:DNA-binding response OmpR family regulator